MSAQQLDFLDPVFLKPKLELEDLFEAYLSCRKEKRRKRSSLEFEVDYEKSLIELWEEINEGTYQPGPSTVFIIDKPVKREVFAAHFKDRIVHHLLINKLNPFFEKEFIYDSYACRVGKGTSFGIQRVERFVRKCSKNYTKKSYALKMDIRGFFMHIDRSLLWARLRQFTRERMAFLDQSIILELCQKILATNPVHHCRIKGHLADWKGLPQDKSLFYSDEECGLPIGNLTSQIFANFYLNPFDHFVKSSLKLAYYGRYVDDFVIIHESKEHLKALVPVIRSFLKDSLRLTLHPKKIYLQEVSKGIPFLGCFLKPHRTYIGDRVKKNFRKAVARKNRVFLQGAHTQQDRLRVLSSLNSYLGLMKSHSTYKVRAKTLASLSERFWSFYTVDPALARLSLMSKNPTRCPRVPLVVKGSDGA